MISLLRFHAALGLHALGRNPAIPVVGSNSRCLVVLFSRWSLLNIASGKFMLQRSRNPSIWLTYLRGGFV
jgi:hypothetical protein